MRTLSKRLIQGWVVSADTKAYKANAGQELRSTLGNTYAQAAIGCADAVCQWAKEHELGPVSVVIEQGQPNVQFVKQAIESLLGTGNHRLERVVSVTVASKSDFVPLQTADFLAHSISTLNLPWIKKLIGDRPGQALWANLSDEEYSRMSSGMKDILKKWRHKKRQLKNQRRDEGA